MIKNCLTSLVARRAVVVVLACALVSIASPRSADASAFMIDLLIGSSSGGGGGASGPVDSSAVDSGVFGLGTFRFAGITNVRLGAVQQAGGRGLQSNRIVEPTGQSTGSTGESHEILNQAPLAGAAGLALSSSSVVPTLTSNVHTQITDSSIASLNLGDGDYLAVSGSVASSLIDNVSGNLPVANGNDEHVTAPPGSAAVGGGTNPDPNVNVAIGAIIPDIATDIVSSVPEITGPLSGSVANGSSAVAVEAVPEPASLLLLGSGLAVAARFVRRRKR
jgi:hypothetical protein